MILIYSNKENTSQQLDQLEALKEAAYDMNGFPTNDFPAYVEYLMSLEASKEMVYFYYDDSIEFDNQTQEVKDFVLGSVVTSENTLEEQEIIASDLITQINSGENDVVHFSHFIKEDTNTRLITNSIEFTAKQGGPVLIN